MQGSLFEVNTDNKSLKSLYIMGTGLRQITHICEDSSSGKIIAFYSDKSFFMISRELRDMNQDLISTASSFKKELKIKPKKKLSGFSFNKSEVDPCMDIYYCFNSQSTSNPVFYGKLTGQAITDVKIFKFEEKNLMGITDRGGYLRIFELPSMTPFRFYKSEYGGFNSLNFESKNMFIALSGEDDAVTLIDLKQTDNRLRFLGHNSFVTSSVFLQSKEGKIYLISGSLDGCLSLVNIDGLKWEEKEFAFKENNKALVNSEGVGCLGFIGEKFFISCFDGLIGVFDYEHLTKERLKNRNIEKSQELPKTLGYSLNSIKSEKKEDSK